MNITKILEKLNKSSKEKDYAQLELCVKELLDSDAILNIIQINDYVNSPNLSRELKDLITLREKVKSDIYIQAEADNYDRCSELRGTQRKVDRIIQADIFREVFNESDNLFHMVCEKEIIYRLPVDRDDAVSVISAIRKHYNHDGKPYETRNRFDRIREQLRQKK
jgi:hypothetical protein